MPTVGLEPTGFISEGHCWPAFYSFGYVKKYAGRYWDSNRIVYFRRPLLACVLLFSLRKEICRPILGLEPNSLFTKATASLRCTACVTPADCKNGTVGRSVLLQQHR